MSGNLTLTELEKATADGNEYRDLATAGRFIEDYHIFQPNQICSELPWVTASSSVTCARRIGNSWSTIVV